MVISREKEGGRTILEKGQKGLIMGLYEIVHMKLQYCKALQNLKHLSLNQKKKGNIVEQWLPATFV